MTDATSLLTALEAAAAECETIARSDQLLAAVVAVVQLRALDNAGPDAYVPPGSALQQRFEGARQRLRGVVDRAAGSAEIGRRLDAYRAARSRYDGLQKVIEGKTREALESARDHAKQDVRSSWLQIYTLVGVTSVVILLMFVPIIVAPRALLPISTVPPAVGIPPLGIWARAIFKAKKKRDWALKEAEGDLENMAELESFERH